MKFEGEQQVGLSRRLKSEEFNSLSVSAIFVFTMLGVLPVSAVADVATLVQVIDTSVFSPPSPDPAGAAYLESSSTILLSDSEVNEMTIFEGVNQFEISPGGILQGTFSSLGFTNEPTGVAVNTLNGHLFYSDDNRGEVYEVAPGVDGAFGTPDDIVTSFDTTAFDSLDPEGIAFDSERQIIYLVEGVGSEVYRIEPGANGVFDGVSPVGDDLVSNFDTEVIGIIDPEGIEFDAVGRQLYLVGSPSNRVAQVTTDGVLVRTIELPVTLVDPAGLALAPGSQNPEQMNLYVADRGIDNNQNSSENDGKVYEFALPPLTPGNEGPVVSAGPDQTLTLPNSAMLEGTVIDDGLPSPSNLAISWSQVSGPGETSFNNPSAASTTATFSLPGTYILRLTASDGELESFDEVTIVADGSSGIIPLDLQVSSSSDDAEQGGSGLVGLSSSDLEMVVDADTQVVGVRFAGVVVPAGATISRAYLQFQTDEISAEPTTLLIQGEAADSALAFSTSMNDISLRPLTASSVTWSPPPWEIVGESGLAQRSPDLTELVQEIVDRPGWASGNALAFIVSGTGKRVAESYDGSVAGAPRLHIEYAGSPGNTAPTVNAGPDQVITLPDAALLNGTASDDGIPSPPALTTTWSYVSGPGTVSFGDTSALATDASFSSSGTYVLRLTASDGELRSADELTVVVNGVGGVVTLEVRVSSGSDDAEENSTGGMYITSSDLELVTDGNVQTVGIRFAGITIPQGSSIANAYIQFQTDEVSTAPTALAINGEASDNAPGFTLTNGDISSRVATFASVPWTPVAWDVTGEAGPGQRSPDIAPVIQEIIGRPGWASGNALVIVITGSGVRTAESYNGSQSGAPLLRIEYSEGDAANVAPVAANVSISGTAVVGQTVTGGYSYSDADGDPEGISTFRWFNSDGPIPGAIDQTYVLTSVDIGQSLRFEVTPVAATGTSPGTPVISPPVGPVQAVNSAPTASSVSISGSPFVGEILTGNYLYSDIDGDPEGQSLYRWVTDAGPVPGATARTYVIAQDDLGANIRFEVTPVAQTGELVGAPVASTPIGPVQEPNSAPVASSVSIAGTAVEGEVLTGVYTFNDADGDPEGESLYRWLNDDGAIAGATALTYQIPSTDIGQTLRFEVTPIAASGVEQGVPVISAGIGPVQRANRAPAATDVSISGVAIEGEILTAQYTYSDADGDAEGASIYQWYNDAGAIPSATSLVYVLQSSDVGSSIRFEVTPVASTGLSPGSTVSSNLIGPVAAIGENLAPVVSAGPDQAISLPGSVTLDGTVTDDGLPNSAVLTVSWSKVSGPGDVFFSDPDASDTTAGFSIAGTYVLRLTASDGALASSDDVAVDVSEAPLVSSLNIRVSSSSDDVEENTSGSIYMTSSDLELVTDGTAQTVGLRFNEVNIPPASRIISARIQFQVDEATSGTANLAIQGEAADSAAPFISENSNVSSRLRTSAVVQWAPPAWNSVGASGPDQETPDISPIIQEIVDRSGWVSSGSVAIMVTGTGARVAESFDGLPSAAPLLRIEYEGGAGNTAPIVSAGTDIQVTLPSTATLNGTVADDGLPAPSSLATSWTQVSGPGVVDFADSTSLTTTASFQVAGTYVLRLTASDGVLESSDDMVVEVSPAAGTGIVEIRIAAGTDDAEEHSSSRVSLNSSDLELVTDGKSVQTVGLRFAGIQIPRGATILNAFIQFQVDESSTVPTLLSFHGEATADAATFENIDGNISTRVRTAAIVSWEPPVWDVVGAAGLDQRSPDITPIVQEITGRADWVSGNSLAIIVTGGGSRIAESYNGSADGAPLLYVEYQTQ